MIYGPNEDNTGFYNIVSEALRNFTDDNIVLDWDLNLVLNADIDYHNCMHINNAKARNKLLGKNYHHNLSDIFRKLHPEKLIYPWCKPHPFKQARIKFFSAF